MCGLQSRWATSGGRRVAGRSRGIDLGPEDRAQDSSTCGPEAGMNAWSSPLGRAVPRHGRRGWRGSRLGLGRQKGNVRSPAAAGGPRHRPGLQPGWPVPGLLRLGQDRPRLGSRPARTHVPGDERRPIVDPTGAVECVAFSPDGRYLAWGGTDSTVKVCTIEPEPSEGAARRFAPLRPHELGSLRRIQRRRPPHRLGSRDGI